MITAKPSPETSRPYLIVSAVFLLLALSLGGVMGFYWVGVLKPRLQAEAVSQAEILARSQGTLIANAIRSGEGEQRVANVVAALDELLLFRDPHTKTAFFTSVALKLDYDTVRAAKGVLDLRRGSDADAGIRTEVALYDPETYELLGIATFRVSDRFFQQLSRDVRRELTIVSLAVVVLLLTVWAVLMSLLSKLQHRRRERDRALNDLIEQEQKYERLLTSLSNYFVYRRDRDGYVEFVSDSATRLLGLPNTEVIRRMQERISLHAPSNGSAAETHVIELTDYDGHLHHIEMSEVKITDASGAVVHTDGIARDVTAQRLVQEELRQAKEQAETANRAKSQFLANMSHEIRTPLNAIIGMTALALKKDPPPKVTEYLDKVRVSAKLLSEIIEDILDLSRIEAGRLEIERVDFDLDELLADLSDVVGVRAGQKNLEILFSTPPDVPRRLRGDPVRLKQVLLNLLNNALKFTRSGEIVVDIVPVEVRRDLAELRFTVRDTGIGIAPEHVSSLFEPFVQVDASMARKYGGAGLGLAISRRLVAMMGGQLEVDSTPNVGSTFSFTVHFDIPRGAAGPRRLADEFRDLPVIVADDNASARAVLANMLRSLSCRVTAVASGEEALAEVQRSVRLGQPYKLAVLDWKMPGLDGAETAAKFASSVELPQRLPVILVTAYDREYAARRADEAGIDAVLHKPISPSTLHDALVRVLDPRQHENVVQPTRTGALPRGKRILLVEDNEINREVARELLSIAGLQITEAHNGYQALDALAASRFDAVLMDVQMPELDGVETVKAIRAQSHFANLPVIAMTAHAMLGDRERFLEAGMSDYISKPIEEEQLLRVLAHWLGNGQSEEAVRPATPSISAPTGLPEVLPGLNVGDGIRRASGNASLYRRLVIEFGRDLGDSVEKAARLIEDGRSADALNVLHTIKGSAATMGARAVADEAASLEQQVRSGAAVTLAALKEAASRVRESIDTLVPALQAAATQVPPPALAGPQLLPIARRMSDHLRENNLAAMTCFDELKSLANGRLGEPLLRLEESLDKLDFDSARTYLEAIESELAERNE